MKADLPFLVRTPHCYHGSPPFVAMVTIFRPDCRATRVPAFDVKIQSANSTAVHVIPKHQTSAISYCLIVRYGFDTGKISCPAWGRCFDVHVISCKKVVKPVSQHIKERLSSSAWLLKQRQQQRQRLQLSPPKWGTGAGAERFYCSITVRKSNRILFYFSYPFDEDSN